MPFRCNAVAEQATAQPADWSAALQQVFSEPWRVRPAFQPVVDLERRDCGASRCSPASSPRCARRRSSGSTPPSASACATALEARLLETGLQAVADVPERCKLLLPVSASTLLEHDVQKELFKHVRVMRHLVLDLTREDATVDVGELIDAIEPVRRDGGRIAVLAGASPGGLDSLPRLRPEVLKVGRDFVDGLDVRPGAPRRRRGPRRSSSAPSAGACSPSASRRRRSSTCSARPASRWARASASAAPCRRWRRASRGARPLLDD